MLDQQNHYIIDEYFIWDHLRTNFNKKRRRAISSCHEDDLLFYMNKNEISYMQIFMTHQIQFLF